MRWPASLPSPGTPSRSDSCRSPCHMPRPKTDRFSFDQAVKPPGALHRAAGSRSPSGPLTAVYLLLLLLVAAGTFVGVRCPPVPVWSRVIVFFATLGVLGVITNFRAWITARAFATRLFSPSGRATRLSALTGGVDHVICTTDLHAGENVYFSRDFVASYRLGWGMPGDLQLHIAVQASAA